MIKELLLGVKEMHDKDICHFDIKSANILLFQNSSSTLEDKPLLQIADFGIASYVYDENKLGIKGTPLYFPPEVAKILLEERISGHQNLLASKSLDCKKVCHKSLTFGSLISGLWELFFMK